MLHAALVSGVQSAWKQRKWQKSYKIFPLLQKYVNKLRQPMAVRHISVC